jgi:Bacterial Ig domain
MNALATTPDHAAPNRRKMLSVSFAATLGSALLAACGGTDNEAPTVTLAAAPTGGVVGATITLVAAAEDNEDGGIAEVRFYRIDASTEALLATVTSSPYLFQTTIPVGATGSVTYLARAVDTDDETADSNTVSVTVTA